MKVLINLTSIKQPLTGIGYYTFNILKLLLDKKIEVVGVHSGKFLYLDELNELVKSLHSSSLTSSRASQRLDFNFKRKIFSIARMIPGAYFLRSILSQSILSKKLNALEKEGYVYFEPNYIPYKYNGKILTTVHDLSYLTCPQFHPQERVKYLTANLKKAIKCSSHIMVDTDFILEEVHRYFPECIGKSSTVHLAVSEDFKPFSEEESEKVLHQHKIKYKKYVLSVATLEPRKNLSRLVCAFKKLPENVRQEYPLVLVGGHGWKNSDLMNEIKHLIEKKEAYMTGYVSDEEIKYIFSGASLFVYPSLYEGFGLPVLEAMASGIPVITSGIGATAEVSSESALHIDPYSELDIRNAIFRVLTDKNVSDALSFKGLARAKNFKWEKTTEQVLQHLLLLTR